MPGIATHYTFGTEIYNVLAHEVGTRERERDAFLLGNQGPDPLFYLVVSPAAKRYRTLGSKMHKEKPSELLFAMHEHLVTSQTQPTGPLAQALSAATRDMQATVRAYALGFLCHYLLDSTIHPLVYAQQTAICGEGIDGMKGRRAARAVHATIETELDEYMMTTHLGTTVAGLMPNRVALPSQPDALTSISRHVADAVDSAYAAPMPASLFALAVQLNRMGQNALDSKGAGLRRRMDYLRPMGLASAYVLSLSHRNEPRPRAPFTNDEHVPWPHPFRKGETVSESFDELYERARQKAFNAIPAYGRTDYTLEQCRKLTGDLNFSGENSLPE